MLKKYEKILNDFEIQEDLENLFVKIGKKLGYEFKDENKEDITSEIIKDEISMERISLETTVLVSILELENWYKREMS